MMIIRGTRLRNRIRDAPIGGDSPRLNHVVGTWNAVCMVIVCRLVKEFGELGSCRLNLTQFVRAPRLQHTFLSFPLPGHAKTRVRHSLYLASNLGVFPGVAAVGGYFYFADGATAGPGYASELVDSGPRQLLSPGRKRD